MNIDRRQKYPCACGCGASASMPHLRTIDDDGVRFYVLPACEDRFRERLAATKQLCDIVSARRAWFRRIGRARTVFRLHRTISRNGTLALRSALIYSLPRWTGMLLARVWKYS